MPNVWMCQCEMKSMLNALSRLNTNYIRSWHILWNRLPRLQISCISCLERWAPFSNRDELSYSLFNSTGVRWFFSCITITLTISSSTSRHRVLLTCGLVQRRLIISIIPVWSFHIPQRKKQRKIPSVSPYLCIILTFWRVTQVRNMI